MENIDFCSQSLRKQHIMLCIDTGLSCVFLKYPCHIIANCKLLSVATCMYACSTWWCQGGATLHIIIFVSNIRTVNSVRVHIHILAGCSRSNSDFDGENLQTIDWLPPIKIHSGNAEFSENIVVSKWLKRSKRSHCRYDGLSSKLLGKVSRTRR